MSIVTIKEIKPARRKPHIEEIEELEKFNPWHDARGRFTFAGGGGRGSFSANPNTKAGQLAIQRAYDSGEHTTFNRHKESKGENVYQNYKWINSGWGHFPGQRKKPGYTGSTSNNGLNSKRETTTMAIPTNHLQSNNASSKPSASKPAASKLKQTNKPAAGAENKPDSSGSKQTTRTGLRSEDGNKISSSEKKKIIKEELGVSDKKAGKYLEVLDNWAMEGAEYTYVQQLKAKGKKPTGYMKNYEEGADIVEDYIKAAPKFREDMYRGIVVDKNTANTILSQARSGDQRAYNNENSTTSWTAKKDVVSEYADPEVRGMDDGVSIIYHATGGNSLATSISHFDGGKGLSEVLASKDAKWEYQGHKWDGNTLTIEVREGKKKMKKSATENDVAIIKSDDDKRLVFGWASIAQTADGDTIKDRQNDVIEPDDLEEAAYEYVLNFRDTGEEHLESFRKKGKLVESCVFTAEKQQAMGLQPGALPVGWWVGFYIEDEDAWERIKNGTYKMFSIEGRAERVPLEEQVGKSIDTIEETVTKQDDFDEIEELDYTPC